MLPVLWKMKGGYEDDKCKFITKYNGTKSLPKKIINEKSKQYFLKYKVTS